jgi:S1-C subfamily serine protease
VLALALIGWAVWVTASVVDEPAVETVATTTTEPPTTTTAPPTTTTAAPPTDDQLVRDFGGATYLARAVGCGVLQEASAFAVDPHHVVTNRHVVVVDVFPDIVDRDGTTQQGRVIGWSEDPDVAVIEVDRELPVSLRWGTVADLEIGDRLLALGFPVPDSTFTAAPGWVMGFEEVDGVRTKVRTNAPIDAGNSGGPAIDVEGHVVGVVTGFDERKGLRVIPLIASSEVMRPVVDGIITTPTSPATNCDDKPL